MNISYILFDCDNTLYKSTNGLFEEISRRMTLFVSDFLGIDEQAAEFLRKDYTAKYGTTLGGLMRVGGLKNPEQFLKDVHPENIDDYVAKNPALKPMLKAIPYPKSIFTNSPKEHAERVLDRLGVRSCFENIFDIRFSQFLGKPVPSSFDRVLDEIGKQSEEVLLIDDMASYLAAFKEMGGEVLLVSTNGTAKKYHLPCIPTIMELPEYFKDAAGKPKK
ncbi:MAG: pyrimidine 5'-nucleotidase [Spirochaetales bacterium]|nr:pyrimidine 5'-nucleotidase [Spirochaetales bacterium]